jgi:hypothetical protein
LQPFKTVTTSLYVFLLQLRQTGLTCLCAGCYRHATRFCYLALLFFSVGLHVSTGSQPSIQPPTMKTLGEAIYVIATQHELTRPSMAIFTASKRVFCFCTRHIQAHLAQFAVKLDGQTMFVSFPHSLQILLPIAFILGEHV